MKRLRILPEIWARTRVAVGQFDAKHRAREHGHNFALDFDELL